MWKRPASHALPALPLSPCPWTCVTQHISLRNAALPESPRQAPPRPRRVLVWPSRRASAPVVLRLLRVPPAHGDGRTGGRRGSRRSRSKPSGVPIESAHRQSAGGKAPKALGQPRDRARHARRYLGPAAPARCSSHVALSVSAERDAVRCPRRRRRRPEPRGTQLAVRGRTTSSPSSSKTQAPVRCTTATPGRLGSAPRTPTPAASRSPCCPPTPAGGAAGASASGEYLPHDVRWRYSTLRRPGRRSISLGGGWLGPRRLCFGGGGVTAVWSGCSPNLVSRGYLRIPEDVSPLGREMT